MRAAHVRRLGSHLMWVAALAVACPAAGAKVFPYRALRRIALPAAANVSALAVVGRDLYAGQGDSVSLYAPTGALRIAHRRLDGTVRALAAVDGQIVVAVSHPSSLEFLAAKSLRVLRQRALIAASPSALLYDPAVHMLFIEDRAGHTVTRLDPQTGRTLGSVRLAGALGQMAANGRGTLYVANATHDAIDVTDARGMRYEGAIPLRRCHAPHALAMDTVGRRLFVACSNGRALIIDADLGFTFVRLPIQRGGHLRAAFAYRPLGPHGWKGGVFIAGGGALSAIQMQAFVRYRAGGRLPVTRRITALALAPAAGVLWLAVARGGGKPAALWRLAAPVSESQ